MFSSYYFIDQPLHCFIYNLEVTTLLKKISYVCGIIRSNDVQGVQNKPECLTFQQS